MRSHFGEALRDWRARRRMSQFDLALDAGVSARHVAFLEKGHSRPSRVMVQQLIEALDVPHRDRNELLVAAGFAPLYTHTPLDSPDLKHLRKGLSRLLERHAPWPGLMLDRSWNIVEMNHTARAMLALVGGDEADANLLTRLANATRVGEVIENWPSLAREFASRMKAEAVRSSDDAMLERIEAFRACVVGDREERVGGEEIGPLFNMRLRLNDGTRLSFYSVIGQFGADRDITAAELRIELFFPADDKSRAAMEKF